MEGLAAVRAALRRVPAAEGAFQMVRKLLDERLPGDASSTISDEVLLLVLLAAAALLVACAAGLALRSGGGGSGRVRRRAVLVGTSGTGKTAMFFRLTSESQPVAFVPSLEPNEGEVKVGPKSVLLVDVPGHNKLRARAFDAHAPAAGAVVFAIDSTHVLPVSRETAEALMAVLGHAAVARRRVPVLVACSMQDLGLKAHSLEFIRKRMEKEITGLIETRKALEQAGAADKLDLGQQEAGGFSFAACRSPVEFVGVSATEPRLGAVEAFLAKHM
ncbi:unnamed protein product [Pedinophyceae sp. YPF-701]|nr:unnamed protein product [Pedinophyceae sp. YPF-701]